METFESHLNFTPDEGVKSLSNYENYCYVCGKRITSNWYYMTDIDCHVECLDGAIEKIKFEEIDRTNFDVKDKPLIWPCIVCGKKMGGGHRWLYNKYFDIDLCLSCDIKKAFFLREFNDETCVIERSGAIFVNIRRPEIINTKNFVPDIEKNENFISLLPCIVNYVDRDPILYWTILEDEEDLEVYHAACGLLINIVDGERIASFVVDDHGRVSIDVIYDKFVDYLKDLEDWKMRRKSPEELNSLDEEIKQNFKTKCSCEDDLLLLYLKFPAYIRLKRNLSFYYG